MALGMGEKTWCKFTCHLRCFYLDNFCCGHGILSLLLFDVPCGSFPDVVYCPQAQSWGHITITVCVSNGTCIQAESKVHCLRSLFCSPEAKTCFLHWSSKLCTELPKLISLPTAALLIVASAALIIFHLKVRRSNVSFDNIRKVVMLENWNKCKIQKSQGAQVMGVICSEQRPKATHFLLT